MPARPSYFHRLADAIAAFRHLESDWIDRRTVEEAIGVSKTVAWRILRQCGAADGPGNTVVCRRDQLIAALERLQQTGEYQREIRRRQRVEAKLEQLLRLAHSRQVRLVPDERALELVSTRFNRLPDGVELTGRRLTVEFAGCEDFLAKIGAVVFALQNDYEAIREFIERTSLPRPADAESSADAG